MIGLDFLKVSVLLPFLMAAQVAYSATVVEFYNPDLDNFFITADPGEQTFVDSGTVGNWQRTGNTFPTSGPAQVCRFYGSPLGPNSHFYTADSGECNYLKAIYDPAEKSWKFESNDFQTISASGGTCPANTFPVYRAYNKGFARGLDSNHRITNNLAAIQEVVGRGWSNEGIVMCSVANGTTTVIPTCPSPQVIHNGVCAQSCPAQFEARNGYCLPLSIPTQYENPFDILISASSGGYRDRGLSVADGSLSASTGCGFGSFATTDGAEFRRLLEDAVRNAGGSISISTPTSWCGTAGGETNCIQQFDNAIVYQTRKGSATSTRVSMLGLLSGHATVVDFPGTVFGPTKTALLSSRNQDSSITAQIVNFGNCSSFAPPAPTKDAVDGNWVGYELSYSINRQSGRVEAGALSCINQNCILSSGASILGFAFTDSSLWRTSFGASVLAGATVSSDLLLLSLYVCGVPLDEAAAFENCRFFSFKRQ